jgi:hypothetical protein
MAFRDLLSITPYPVVSAVISATIAVAGLYLARDTAHRVISTLFQALHDALKLGVQALNSGEGRLSARNREVLLAAGREAKERIIQRELHRIGDSVHKDLGGCRGLQRTLSETIARIDEDHQRAVDVPPDPPTWVKAVEAVAKLDARADGTVSTILGEIHKALVKAHDNALGEYRDASRKRHALLGRMLPHWRRIQETLKVVNKNVENLLERSRTIDRHVSEYEEMVRGTDRAVHVLSSSSVVQFFVAALVLSVAIGGAAINFSLIARPMAEMVGGTSFIGELRTADIAALVIIMVEISMGLFLMESLRITGLFPVISALPDKLRVRMIGVTFAILLMLASVEAGLAYMREILMQDSLATAQLLRGGAALPANDYRWITTAAQMGMGFTLPFALVFVAIPLETFVHSLRTVLGLLGIGLLRAVKLVLRVFSGLCLHGGTVLTRLYDIPIFMPLWIEAAWHKQRRPRKGAAADRGYVEAAP